jgi:hypothetical protein
LGVNATREAQQGSGLAGFLLSHDPDSGRACGQSARVQLCRRADFDVVWHGLPQDFIVTTKVSLPSLSHESNDRLSLDVARLKLEQRQQMPRRFVMTTA